MATGRDEDALDSLARETGVDCVAGALDAPDTCARIIEETNERIGPVDILINNAGTAGELAPVWQLDPGAWRKTLAVNLDAPFELTRLTAGAMVERGSGRIVMIASVAAERGSATASAYCASKHGLLGLMRSIAQDVGAYGVTCNAICPGGVLTPLAERLVDRREAEGIAREDAYAEFVASNPAKRWLDPDEIAAVVAFLISAEASGINGEALTVALGG
jgi:NAD(P)-dependent dehydrogenase (short-subunit alcohol dehydrogenase family)